MTAMGPLAHADGRAGVRLCDKPVPGVAGCIDDVVVGFEDAVREPVGADVLPYLLAGFSSGARDGRKISVMFLGTLRLPVVCQPARSRSSTAWLLLVTVRDISSR